MSKPDRDRIEKQIEVRAPRSRVWRAISSPKDVGTWFGLGEPLEIAGELKAGAQWMGTWRVDGKEVRELFCTIEVVEPESLLAFRWVPFEVPAGEDAATQPTTRIEMRLEDIPGGTRLTVSESGFASLPADKQYKREQNGDGWAVQVHSIARYVLGTIEVRVEDRIARPVDDVFEAIIDPARMAQYFVTHGSARMEAGKRVTWEFGDVGVTLDVEVRQVSRKSVSFLWRATGTPTVVTLTLEADGDATKITAVELPFELSEEAAVRATGQVRGWTDFCLCLKAYLVHGINLRTGTRVA